MSFFDSQTLKAKLSKLDQLEKSNQLKLKKVQDISNIKIDKDQYLKYKHILFNHPKPSKKPVKEVTTQATQTQTQPNDENNNILNLSKPISLLDNDHPHEKNPPSQSIYRKEKNVYEFPKQMTPKESQESDFGEASCQTENDLVPENGYFNHQGYNDQKNVIIMEEMNPNLSFSSCPVSDLKAHLKDSFGDYHHFRTANERVLGELRQKSSEKKDKKTRLIEYGGESVEVSVTESDEAHQEEQTKKLQEEYNMYKKKILHQAKASKEKRITTESDESNREETEQEQDSVQLEYQALLEQRKALEMDISHLRKIQDEASKGISKKFEQKVLSPKSPRSPRFTLNQPSSSSSQHFFEGIEERISEIALNHDSARKFTSGRKGSKVEEPHIYSSEETEETEEIETEEDVKTRRLKEDGWKVSHEFWDTRRRFGEAQAHDMNEELEEEEEISEDRFYPKKGEDYRQNPNEQRNEGERKSRIRELIDQVGASIEEIRRKKTYEQKNHHHMEDEHSLSKRALYMVGSGSKDLVPISEEVSEEM